VRREVVEHHMNLQITGNVEIDELEKPQHVGGLVTLPAVVEDLPGPDVHRRDPTTSTSLASNAGSFETLNASVLHGFNP
jgi:hypothetical protein